MFYHKNLIAGFIAFFSLLGFNYALAEADKREAVWKTYQTMKTDMQAAINNEQPSGAAAFFHASQEYSSPYAKIKEEVQWWKADAKKAGLEDQIEEITALLEKMDALQERFNYLNILHDDLKQPTGLYADLESQGEATSVSTLNNDLTVLKDVLKDENHLVTEDTRDTIEQSIVDIQKKIKALKKPSDVKSEEVVPKAE